SGGRIRSSLRKKHRSRGVHGRGEPRSMNRLTIAAFTIPPALAAALAMQVGRSQDSVAPEADLGRSVDARDELAPSDPPRKEPPYGGAKPTYCQLAVGDQGTERMWVVLAPPTLYVDSNADGDLTAADEAHVQSASTFQTEVPLRLRSGVH